MLWKAKGLNSKMRRSERVGNEPREGGEWCPLHTLVCAENSSWLYGTAFKVRSGYLLALQPPWSRPLALMWSVGGLPWTHAKSSICVRCADLQTSSSRRLQPAGRIGDQRLGSFAHVTRVFAASSASLVASGPRSRDESKMPKTGCHPAFSLQVASFKET